MDVVVSGLVLGALVFAFVALWDWVVTQSNAGGGAGA